MYSRCPAVATATYHQDPVGTMRPPRQACLLPYSMVLSQIKSMLKVPNSSYSGKSTPLKISPEIHEGLLLTCDKSTWIVAPAQTTEKPFKNTICKDRIKRKENMMGGIMIVKAYGITLAETQSAVDVFAQSMRRHGQKPIVHVRESVEIIFCRGRNGYRFFPNTNRLR